MEQHYLTWHIMTVRLTYRVGGALPRSMWSSQRRQLSQKAPKRMIRRTEDKAFRSKSLPLWKIMHRASMYIQAHECSWGATGATKGGSCPRKPQSERSGGQKTKHFRAKVYHCDRLLAVSMHVNSITQVCMRSNWSNQRRQLSQKAQSQWSGGQKTKHFRAKVYHSCIFKHTSVREEQLEQPKQAAVPKAPKRTIRRTEDKAFQSKSLPLWQIACSEHACKFNHTSVHEEQLEQPTEAAVPESPKANELEDTRQSISEQKRRQAYHREIFLA